jgi:metal-dependent amidase/aminoacylase/carboxypeptidase family protein
MSASGRCEDLIGTCSTRPPRTQISGKVSSRYVRAQCHRVADRRTPLRHAHDALTSFLSKHGFQVTPHYLLPTAWLATFTHSVSTPGVPRKLRTLGINSEMDALPGVGHACGHNLIAVAGVAVACAAKAAMEKWNIQGRIELLGTPGKVLACCAPHSHLV